MEATQETFDLVARFMADIYPGGNLAEGNMKIMKQMARKRFHAQPYHMDLLESFVEHGRVLNGHNDHPKGQAMWIPFPDPPKTP